MTHLTMEQLVALRDGASEPGTAAVRASDETSPDMAELANLVDVAASLVHAATARTESRGNHWRADHPEMSDRQRVRLVHNRPS